MYKKIISFLIFCIVFSFLLVGCSSAIYSSGCVSINYNGSKYNYLSEWEMLSDNYIVKSIEQDGVNLSIRSYDDDTRDEFLFCEDNGSLYHNESYILPENKVENIDHLLFSFHGSNDELNILDSDTIYEFTKIFFNESQSNIDFLNNIFTIVVYYKDFPAINYCGNIVTDKDGKYWFHYSCMDDEFNYVDKYYPIESNSKLLSYLK